MVALLLGMLIVVILAALGVAGWLLYYSPTYRYNPTQTANLLAARWLDLTQGEYTEGATREFVRREYLSISATFGLPLSAADAVIDGAWTILARASGEQPIQLPGAGLYE